MVYSKSPSVYEHVLLEGVTYLAVVHVQTMAFENTSVQGTFDYFRIIRMPKHTKHSTETNLSAQEIHILNEKEAVPSDGDPVDDITVDFDDGSEGFKERRRKRLCCRRVRRRGLLV